MKIFKRLLLGTGIIVLLAFIGTYFFLKKSLPPMDGRASLPGLNLAVTVTRDTYGIPHIKAANKLDALKALGYVMASERLFQMEISRRMTQGTLSEIFGEVALPSDKLYRSLMIKKSMERMLAQERKDGTFDPILWAEMEAYFEGVNQFIQTRPLPYEFSILSIRPEPFTPIDAYVMTGHMAYSFGIALKADPLMTALAQKLSVPQFQSLRNDPLSAPLKIVQNSGFFLFQLATENQFTGLFDGSNAWLIGPRRSQSGKSIFANDPHIGFSSPSVWVEAHIKTPDFELYGHFLPLIPYAILGHNRHHAWGFTMSLVDDMDLFREKIDRNSKTAIFKGEPNPYNEWTETIKVKNAPDVVMPMIETAHGPVMDAAMTEKNLSLQWAFLKISNNPMKSLRLMAETKSISEFEHALKYATAPGLNVMYADAENIAWWTLGDIAVKANPNSDMILDGASGQDEYLRTLSWEEKPHAVNPDNGIIITANSRPAGLAKDIRGDWQPDDRYQTIAAALAEKDQWSAEDFKALQTKNFNIRHREVLEALLENLDLSPAEEAEHAPLLQSLKSWNLHSETNSAPAALFHLWNNENVRLILSDLTPELRTAYLTTPYPWNFYRRILLEPHAEWFQKRSLKQTVTEGFRNVVKSYHHIPTWGEIHTIEFKHPLGRFFPLNKIFNLGPYPVAGAYNEINNNKPWYFGGDNFNVVAGASTRRIIDFAEPQRSWGVNPIGISGHILSPFFKDQIPLFLEGKYRPQLMDEADIQKSKTHELILQ